MTGRRGHGEGDVHLRPDGRWEARVDLGWQDGKRTRKSVYGKTKREVLEKLRRAQREKDLGRLVADERQTVGEFLEWWQSTVLPGTVGEGSLEAYRRRLRLYVIPAVGKIRLTHLRPGHVTEMMRSMERRGLSAATQDSARKVLSKALRRAAQEGLVVQNVAQLADPPKVVHGESRAMTADEVVTFLRALEGERLKAAYLTAVVLGLRRGELLGLRWDDVDLDAAEPAVEIRQQLQRREGRGLVLAPLKTPKSRRRLVLPPRLVAELRAWRAAQAADRLAAGPGWADDSGLVFTTPLGTPVDPDNFRHRLSTITARAGLGAWRTHELRKTTGSVLFDQGVPMKLISETLGHSSERVTSDVYVKTRSTARAVVAAAMADALWPAAETS